MNLEEAYATGNLVKKGVKEKGAAEPEDLEAAVAKECDDVHTVWSAVSPQTVKDWTSKNLQHQAQISFEYAVSLP